MIWIAILSHLNAFELILCNYPFCPSATEGGCLGDPTHMSILGRFAAVSRQKDHWILGKKKRIT